jgi:hypothetical protein
MSLVATALAMHTTVSYVHVFNSTFIQIYHSIGTIPARFNLIWFSGFRGEDLNVIFYQNMPNFHNRYILAERKISEKNAEYMLNYSLPCRCSKNLSSF